MLESIRDRVRRSPLRFEISLIAFSRLSLMIRLASYLRDVDPGYRRRLALIVACTLLSTPLRLAQSILHGRRIAAVRIAESPIFIIGHWRSGTTHLHNLLSQDPRHGYVSMYQTAVPNFSLIGERWLKPLLSWITPTKRPMDDVIWPMDAPQEEEVALAKMTPYSFYVRVLFPRKARQLFRQFVMLEGAPPSVAIEIKRAFLKVMQIATLHAGGKRLVLKNPVNTGRIGLLLELFPDAKFVHVYRCPYDVYVSTVHLYNTVLPLTALQAPRGDSGGAVIDIYEDLMRQFFADRARIPAGNIVDVRFEDLERDPAGQVQHIYRTLGLPGYDAAEPAVGRYIASLGSYRKNSYTLPAAERARIIERWGFAFRELGYATAEDETPALAHPQK